MKRALLLGSQTGRLQGVHSDVERLSAALELAGFRTRRCVQTQASRDGILQAYRALVDETTSDDAVCIYYSGHGNLAANPAFASGARVPQFLQYIIPTDDSPAEFRGVMNFELSALQTSLCRKTRNVTVILDCCHAARLSRSNLRGDLIAKGLERIREDGVAALIRDAAAWATAMPVESNPDALRLVAAEAETSAFEYTNARGQRTGALTDALLDVLDELGNSSLSWAAFGLRLRELVMQRIPDQRPDLEGPRNRLLWSSELAKNERPLSLFFELGEPMLRGGRLFGALPGATYGIMPAGSDAYAAAAELARAVVVENRGSLSLLRLEQPEGAAPLQSGLPAFALDVPFRRRAVLLDTDEPEQLRGNIEQSRFLLLAGPGQLDGAARVELVEQGLVVSDALGKELQRSALSDANALTRTLARLENWARADDLRQLEPGALAADFSFEYGRVVNSERVPMAQGEPFHVGDALYVSLVNRGDSPLFAAIFNIDAAYDVALLSQSSPRGRKLERGEALLLGVAADGALSGLPSSWPSSVPPDGPRWESLIAIVAEDQQDFLLLTTPPARGERPGSRTALEARLAQNRGGAARARRGEEERPSEYCFRRIDYDLHPAPRG